MHQHAHDAHDGHGAGAARTASRKRLVITLVLVVSYMIAEVIGGIITNSLALLADAGHMLTDAAALGLSLFALWMAQRPASSKSTFGHYRAEILAALVNGAALVAIAIYIFIEAYQRFLASPPVMGGVMMVIAIGGLLINVAGLFVLHSARNESLNVKGAWLHVLGDAMGSVGAIVGGLLIWLYGWLWADPLVSVVIGVLIVYSSWNLLKQATAVLMEQAPGHIDVDEVRQAMMAADGVTGVHDLHVWSITTGQESLSAHVSIEDRVEPADLLRELRRRLHDRFGIDHVTLQLDPEGFEENCVGLHA